jgi:plastocyanin
MKTLHRRLTLIAAVLAVALSAVWVFAGTTPALADDGPVKFTIKITDAGFQPDTIDVPMNATVELTFVWDSQNHPDDQHIISVPGYKLESEKIDHINKQTVLSFVATKSGTFTFKCDFECDTHDILQHGTINVTAGGAGTTGSSGGGSQLQVPKLVIDPVTGIVIKGNSVSIAAALQDKDGKPIAKAEVLFYANRTFLGRTGEVPIAVGKTDATGLAYATYHPTNSDGGKIIARFEGGGLYDKAEQTVTLAASDQFQPIPQSASDDNLHGIKKVAPYVLVIVIGLVWAAFAFMLFQAWSISRVRSGGAQ